MAKNKKKKAQMFRDFLAFKAGQGNQSTSFQTPHSDQEKLTELLDDNVGGGPNQLLIKKPSESSNFTPPVQNISKWTALRPVEDVSNIQVNMRQDTRRPNLTTIVEGSSSKIQLIKDKSMETVTQPSHSLNPNTYMDVEPSVSTQAIEPIQIQQVNANISTQAYAQTTQPSNISRYPYNTQGVKPASVAFVREEKSPSPHTNPQDKNAKNTPSWIPAPHVKPVWQSQQSPRQSNQGSGWPKSKSTATNTNLDGYWPTGQKSGVNDTINVQVDMNTVPPQAYSPSELYSEAVNEERATDEETESSELLTPGSKRLSAFQRLGPLAEQPKKTKLTINLLCQKDVRNVVDETDDIPTHLRDYITSSTDEIILKYLEVWPFKKNIVPARTASVRCSKTVMILETEYMEEAYLRDNRFILIVVTGYPQHWNKEDVLDAVLESVKYKSLIPCFIEFSRVQCKFLVIRSRLALLAIHKYGFVIRKGDVELIVSISNVHVNLNQLDFVPRLIVRKMLSNRLNETSLDLSNFTTKCDISHFIYFPLYRLANQTELIQLQSTIPWQDLTSLDLSHNRITSLDSFDLSQTTPKLKHLNLSYNRIEKATVLLHCRDLPLRTINLEGNPLCNDFIEQNHYIKVLTMMFSGLAEIDGVPIKKLHDLPNAIRNFCPEDAQPLIDKVLEVLFPLLDASQEQRYLMEQMYHEDAVLTITFMYRLRYCPVYRNYRNLFNRARVLDEGEMDTIIGPSAIIKVFRRWPDLLHDPATFNVDVLYHSDTTTIVRINGIVKITAESLADDEYLLLFTRTLVLHTRDGIEYKITNELLYWDLPEKEYAETAFQVTRIKPKNLSLKLDAPPDADLKEKLLNVFMQITELEKQPSERCLEEKDWNIRNALEYFTKLLKLNNLDPILK